MVAGTADTPPAVHAMRTQAALPEGEVFEVKLPCESADVSVHSYAQRSFSAVCFRAFFGTWRVDHVIAG